MEAARTPAAGSDVGTPLHLSALAERINREHESAERAINDALQHARQAGELLLEAKGAVEHGDWGDWLKVNFRGSWRTANKYMRLAERWTDIAANSSSGANLSINDALALIADSRDDDPDDGDALEPEAVGPAPADETASEPEPAAKKPDPPAAEPDPPASEPEPVDPEPEPEPLPDGVGADDAEPDIDPIEEWERAEREVQRLQGVIESLSEDDLSAEVARLNERVARMKGRLDAETRRASEAAKQARYQGRILGKLRDLLDCGTGQLPARVMELLQR